MKLYPKAPKPLIYLSGGHTSMTDAEEARWIRKAGVTHRCCSFAYTCPDAFYYSKRMHRSLDNSLKAGVGIMMDSGAHSFHKLMHKSGGKIANSKTKNKLKYTAAYNDELTAKIVNQYAEYCKANWKAWDFYITFDYVMQCPVIRAVTEDLRKRGLVEVVPVYHGDQSLDWFRRYCEECKLVAVGMQLLPSRTNWHGRRYYYDQLFNIAAKHGTKLHGLAATTLTLMFQYPWHSVDSSTHAKTAAYGKIICIDPHGGVLSQLHISDQPSSHSVSYNTMPKAARRQIERMVEGYGFDFQKVRTDTHERCMFNACLLASHMHELRDLVKTSRTEWEVLL